MLYDAPLDPPIAVVLGNEAHGLPATVAAGIDEWVHIPMAGQVESLNVAVAGALVSSRSRAPAPPIDWTRTAARGQGCGS